MPDYTAMRKKPVERPFVSGFRMQGGLRTPFAVLLLEAGFPLVRSYEGFYELREGFVESARIVPGLYLEGITFAAMGGEPYSNWS